MSGRRGLPLPKLLKTTVFRLSLIYLAVFLAVGGAAVSYLGWQAERLLRDEVRAAVEADVEGLIDQYQGGGIRRLADALQRRSLRPDANLYLVTSFSGEPLAGNVRNVPSYVLQRARWVETSYGPLDTTETLNRRAVINVSILPGGFRLLVGRDLAQSERFEGVVRTLSVWTLIGFGTAWLVVSLVLSRRVLARVDKMAAAGRAIMHGRMTERLPIAGSDDEIDRLATGLNEMLSRIDGLMHGLKDVSDNIAHDLKTPITRVRNIAEEALRPGASADDKSAALERVTEEVDGIIRLFDALLLVTRVEAGNVDDALSDLDAAAIATDIGELYEPSAADAGMALTVDAEPAPLRGNRELLGQALTNLVDNAIKYAGNDATTIAIEAHPGAGQVVLSVSDDGVGVAERDLARAVERFERLGRSEPGSGLGLSLVRAIAHLHGGRLELAHAEPGLAARLVLPTTMSAKARPPDRR